MKRKFYFLFMCLMAVQYSMAQSEPESLLSAGKAWIMCYTPDEPMSQGPNGTFTIDGVSYECKVSLPDEWILSVMNAYTGDIVYNAKAKGTSTVFDTSDWKQGVYIAACEVDGKVTTKKFTIK